jgi:hypothetical protein
MNEEFIFKNSRFDVVIIIIDVVVNILIIANPKPTH